MTTTLNVGRTCSFWLAIVLAFGPLSSHAQCTGLLESLDRLESMVGAENTARDALTTIRRNAQDWKNLLLRGRDNNERQTMQTRFDTQGKTYVALLLHLRGQMSQLSLALDRLDVLDREQLKLFDKYRAALARHGVDSLESAAAADREVQGADVVTFRTLEQTIEVLSTSNLAQFQTVRQSMRNCQALNTSIQK